jgi:hypothetical protein
MALSKHRLVRVEGSEATFSNIKNGKRADDKHKQTNNRIKPAAPMSWTNTYERLHKAVHNKMAYMGILHNRGTKDILLFQSST